MLLPKGLLALCSALVLAACHTVTSPVPLGERPAVIQKEHWEGRWYNADGYLDLTVTDASKGLLRVAYDEDGEHHEMDFELRQAGDWIIANVRERDFDESEGLAGPECQEETSGDGAGADCGETSTAYLWNRVVQSDNSLLSWAPDAAAFVRLVEEGVIPGTVDEGSVVLGPLEAQHYRAITSGSHGVVLDWEHPTVLYRFPPGKKPQ